MDTYTIADVLNGEKDGLPEKMLALGDVCKSVVCARVSPAQKGDIVTLVRKGRVSLTLCNR